MSKQVISLVPLFRNHSLQAFSGEIGQITPTGTIIEFPIPSVPDAILGSITPGSDGNLWFTDDRTGGIGRITP